MIGMTVLCCIVVTVTASVIWRARAIPRIPILFWPIGIITSIVPIYTGYFTLFPQKVLIRKRWFASMMPLISKYLNHSLWLLQNWYSIQQKRTKRPRQL